MVKNYFMDKETKAVASTESIEKIVCIPFVNEECGDTMWDDVLKAGEKVDKEQLTKPS
jgi:hypothetical protein